MLSVVGTPIGNLDDMAPRAIATLERADVILCEDTRVTGKLLSHFGIRVPLVRADENVLAEKIAPTLERIESGQRVAFASDAGMPGVSDPGQRLVDAALERGLRVEVIPGPSAVTCALVASGPPMDHFFFEGFLPRKQGQRVHRIEELAPVPGALVFYESPHRVAATLEAIAQVLPTRRVALVRELTKVHEEVVRDVAPALAERIAAREEIRGECVIVVEGPTGEETSAVNVPLEDAIREGLAAGEPKSVIAKRLAREYGLNRSEVYDRLLAMA
jgi:16S rRNA (cytidine1402-2'-O)-methyltransferase